MRGSDILTTALYGGIDYWAVAERRGPDEAVIHDLYEDERHTVTAGQLEAASDRVMEKYPRTNAAHYILTDDIDAEAADVIVQVALYDEILYG